MKKLGNIKQILSAYDVVFTSGAESGKNCVLVYTDKGDFVFTPPIPSKSEHDEKTEVIKLTRMDFQNVE